jgi:hypothetical protein
LVSAAATTVVEGRAIAQAVSRWLLLLLLLLFISSIAVENYNWTCQIITSHQK